MNLVHSILDGVLVIEMMIILVMARQEQKSNKEFRNDTLNQISRLNLRMIRMECKEIDKEFI